MMDNTAYMVSKRTLLQAKALQFGYDPHEPLFRGLDLAIGKDARIGLVGPNGSGKSTLLRILDGQIEPDEGKVLQRAFTFYVPQFDANIAEDRTTIRVYIEKSLGIECWWEVLTHLSARFGANSVVDIEQEIRTISGGEWVRLHLAAAIHLQPEVLLLDEPTNHLDLQSLQVLEEFIDSYNGAIVIVSHDIAFLNDTVRTIWALDKGLLEIHEGTYEDYATTIDARARRLHQQIGAARSSVRSARAALQRAQINAARSRRANVLKSDSMPKSARNYLRNRSEKSTGRAHDKASGELESAKTELADLTKVARGRRTMTPRIEVGSKKRRHLLGITDAQLLIPSLASTRILLEHLNFDVFYGDRIVLLGRNGSGKTTFLRALIGETDLIKGDHYVAERFQALFLEQDYRSIDPNISLYDNLLRVAPHLQYEEIRQLMADFLFRDESQLQQLAGTLSGGESARLALAMGTAAKIDLIILDEPTNNLDIESLDQLVEVIRTYPGAVIVVSHNLDFLGSIGIESSYAIRDRQLQLLSTNPSDGDDFVEEALEL